MQEVVPPSPTLVVGLTLGNLILMMGEGQVDASGMDVQLTSKHGTAGCEIKSKRLRKMITDSCQDNQGDVIQICQLKCKPTSSVYPQYISRLSLPVLVGISHKISPKNA